MIIRTVGTGLFHADTQTCRSASRFSLFCERA